MVFLFHVDFFVIHFVGWDFQLDVSTRTEGNILTFWQFKVQLFDERGHIRVAGDFTFPTLNANRIFWDFNFEILLNSNLARQSPVFTDLTAGKMPFLCRQDATATFGDTASALRTGTTATAGTGQEDPF